MIKYSFEVHKTVCDGNILWIAQSLKFQGCSGKGLFLSDSLSELAKSEKAWMNSSLTSAESARTM